MSFEGPDRTLVAPTYNSMLPNNVLVTAVDPTFNRFMNAWDYAGQNMLYGWAYPVRPGITGIPARLHVVGSVVQRSPLQLSVPGNNFATVVAGEERPVHGEPGDPGLDQRMSAREITRSCCPPRSTRGDLSCRSLSFTSRCHSGNSTRPPDEGPAIAQGAPA